MQEIDRRPSKLEELLEAFRHPISGHIEISPRVARTILLERLLAFYKTVVGRPSANVEVLAQLAGTGGDEESDYKLVDFSEALKKFKEERDIKVREKLEHQHALSIKVAREPRQEEI